VADSAGASSGLIGRGPQLFILDGVPADGKTTQQVAEALRRQVALIAREGVSDAELNRVKTQWVASETYKLDSVASQARELGSNWIQGLPLDGSAARDRPAAHRDAAEVQAVAAKYFGDDQMTMATLLPQASGPEPQTPQTGRHHPALRPDSRTGRFELPMTFAIKKRACCLVIHLGYRHFLLKFSGHRPGGDPDPALDAARRRAGLPGRKPGHRHGRCAD
jgi:hypothetical protein